MLKSSGRRIDLSRPFVDAMLPDGHRLHVVLEGISRGFSAVNIRKFVLKAARLSDLVELGSLTPSAAAFLEASVRAGLNILVAGGTQAGKTTLLNCLAAAIPGGDRVVSAEEVFELRFPHPDWVPMQTRQAGLEGTGEIALRDLVRESLRMRPSRIIVGEVRVRGVPRSAPGTQCRAARHVHPPRQQCARGAGEDVHVAVAGGREHLGAVRGSDRRGVGRPRRPSRGRRRAAYAGSTRWSPSPAGSRTTSSRPRPSSSASAPSWWLPEGCPRGWIGSSGPASTSTASLPVVTQESADGAVDRARGGHRPAAGLVGVRVAAGLSGVQGP